MTMSDTHPSARPAQAKWTIAASGDLHHADAAVDIATALADPSLAALHNIGAPLIVTAAPAARLLFASASACALFGTRDPEVLQARIFGGNHPASRRLVVLAGNVQASLAPKLERLRFFFGTSAETLTVLCRTLIAPSGAAMFVFAAMGVRAALMRPLPAVPANAASPANATSPAQVREAGDAAAHSAADVPDSAGQGEAGGIKNALAAAADAGEGVGHTPETLATGALPESVLIHHGPAVPSHAGPAQLPASPADLPAAAMPVAAFTWPDKTVRFAWRSDARDIVTDMGAIFMQSLKLHGDDVTGQSWQALATRFGFDPGGLLPAALQLCASFSGLVVIWPLAGGGHVPVTLGGAPVFDANRSFDGHRGFGLIRFEQRVAGHDIATTAPVAAAAAPAADGAGVFDASAPAAPTHGPTSHLPDLHRAPKAESAISVADPAEIAVAALPRPAPDREHLPESVAAGMPQPGPVDADIAGPDVHHAGQDALKHRAIPLPENSFATVGAVPAPEPAQHEEHAQAPMAVQAILADAHGHHDAGATPAAPPHPPHDDIAATVEIEMLPAEAPVADIATGKFPVAATEAPELPDVTTPAQVPGLLTPHDYHEHRHGMLQPHKPGHEAEHADTRAEPGQKDTKVVRLRPLMVVPPSPEPFVAPAPQVPSPQALSKAEHHAFYEIARKLGVQDADLPVVASPPEPTVVAKPRTDAPVAIMAQPAPVAETDAAAVLQRLPLGVLVSRDGQPLFINRCLLDMLGYADQHGFAVSHGMERMFRGRQPEALDPAPEGGALPVVALNGEIIMAEARLQSIDWGGAAATLMSFRRAPDSEPLQRQHTLELELRQSEAKARQLHAIIDTATDGVVVLDDKGRILSLNASAEALFGYGQNEVAGQNLLTLIARDSQAAASEYLEGMTGNGVATPPGNGREVIGRARQGEAIPLFMTLGRVGDGPDPKFCAMLRDLTPWKKAERDLSDARQQAEHASALKSDFLAKISHEIRTPLNAILGFAEVMIEERFGTIGNDRYKEYLGDIHVSGKHVMSLVNDLLDLSKIEAGKLDLEFSSVDANKIIAECVAMMQPEASRERVVMRQSLAARLPNVVADERALRQIVINLLSNAVKFNEAGGQVIVSTTLTDAGHAVIRIRDTGIGMSEADVLTALEPFKQLHTSRKHSGTGLGLPLTKALVEANRAVFTIKSKKGEGTLAEVAFPPTRVLAE